MPIAKLEGFFDAPGSKSYLQACGVQDAPQPAAIGPGTLSQSLRRLGCGGIPGKQGGQASGTSQGLQVLGAGEAPASPREHELSRASLMQPGGREQS